MREGINSAELTPPVGPFSHAVKSAGVIYFSGQVAQHPATGRLIEGDVKDQTEQIFNNLQLVLKAVGKDFGDVLKVNVYLTSMADFGSMNEVFARYFEPPYPARTTVAVAALPLSAKVEMEMVLAA
jgi:2-iminobutanoate/2-iminopropanoate deaminase